MATGYVGNPKDWPVWMGTTPDVPGAQQIHSLFHWQVKGSKNQNSLLPQLFYCMSQLERVFHLNSEVLMNGQTSCKPSGPEALILPTVHFLDGLPYSRHLCLASLLWACQRGVEHSLGQSDPPMQHVSWSWPASILFLSVCGLLSSGVKWERIRKERKTTILASPETCLWTDRAVIGMAGKKRLKFINLLPSVLCYKMAQFEFWRHFDHTRRICHI